MGSGIFAGAMRGVGRNALDLPVAALAGLSVAFVAFAAPGDILAQLVGASGLPSLLSAAEPPLGMKARIGIAAAGAVAVFAAVFFLLRLLDRFGGGEAEPEFEPAEPRLRRRDFHPDAPVRRPLSAALDLGEPEQKLEPELEPEPELEQSEPVRPLWLSAAEVAEEPVEPRACFDPYEQTESELVLEEPAAFEPELEPEVQVEPPFQPEARQPKRPVIEAPCSIPELMERLERGLARRRQPPAAAEAPQVFPEAAPDARDDRLQSAIDSLQRLASRQS